MNANKSEALNEGVSYIFWGICSTIVNWGVYTATISMTPLSMAVCNFLAWLSAILFAYVTNKLFVFHAKAEGKKGLLREFVLFLGARIFTGIFEVLMPSVLYRLGVTGDFLNIRGFFAKAVVSVFVIIGNFILSKWMVFRKAPRT